MVVGAMGTTVMVARLVMVEHGLQGGTISPRQATNGSGQTRTGRPVRIAPVRSIQVARTYSFQRFDQQQNTCRWGKLRSPNR